MQDNDLKEKVKAYWNRESCGTGVASSDKFTRQYFNEIEEHRYTVEPEIFAFAQFTRYYGKKMLEVGVGAIKIMIYNRRSVYTFYLYLYWGLLKGKPFMRISEILWHHQESIGTKAYTVIEKNAQ